MTRSYRSFALVSCAIVLSTPPLLAQQPDSSARDSSMSIRRYRLPPVIVTGSLSTFSQDKSGVARSVISHDRLRAEPARAAVDPLRHTTGVFVDEATGPLGPTIIRIRGGEETFTKVAMDGVPINENGGFFDAQGLTLVNVDRVEVARGPQSALYGSSAMSGVVQMFTRAGESGPMRTEASVEGGRATSYGGSLRASVEASGGTDAVRYSFGVGSAYDRGPYRLPNDLRANDASLRMDFLSGGAFALTGVARFMGVDAKLPVRNPGITRAPLDPNQRQGRDRTLGSLAGVWMPSERWTHRLSVSYYRRDFTYDDTSDGLDQSQFSSFVFDFNYHYTSIVRRATGRYVGTVMGAPRSAIGLSFSYGGEWERETLTDEQSGDFGPASSSLARPSVAAFGEGQARLGNRLSLIAGSRVEKFKGLKAAYVPRATAVLDVVPARLALRATVSRAYKAPNIQEQFPSNPVIVANPDLKPETSRSWEAGTDLTAAEWRTVGSVTYFSQEYENLIRSVNYDASGRQINRNLGRSRATGIEAEVVVQPRTRWEVGASSAWTTTRIIDNGGLPSAQFPNGASLPFRPTYTASAFVGLPASRAISVITRVTAVGRQTVLTDRFRGARVSIAPYHVLAATGTWAPASSADVYVQVENILNHRYETAYDRPGMSRTAALGVRLRR